MQIFQSSQVSVNQDFEDLYNLSNTIPTLTSSIIEKAEIKNTKIMKLFEGKLIKID